MCNFGGKTINIAAMQTKLCMIYRDVIAKRLERKRQQLAELEKRMDSGNDVATAVDKRKYVELKAVVNELENCLDIADSMFNAVKDDSEKKG